MKLMAVTSILSGISPDILSFATSFVFMFAVVFALLVYSGIFGRKSKDGAVIGHAPKGPLVAIAAVIAVVAALYQPFVTFLQQIIPLASIALVVIFFLVFIKQLIRKEGKGDPWPAMIGMAAVLLVLGIAWPSVQTYLGFTGISPDVMLWAIGIVVILLIFYMAYSAREEK